jgi:type VI secretion system protein ImpK
MISSLPARMYWACAESLCLASELASARDLPAPDVLQRRLAGMLEDMTRRCREAGIPDEDINEARYAIVAFTDEQIFRSAWPGRGQWMRQPLQLSYYNENTAGEGFFRHMAGLQTQPHRAHVLQIFYLCLCLGFQGQYAVHGWQGLAPIIEQLGQVMGAVTGGGEVISPHGAPPERVRGWIRQQTPVVGLSIALFASAIVVFAALKVTLLVRVWNIGRDLTTPALTHAGH